MENKRNLRRAIRNILKEDAARFEDMIKYASELDGEIRQDAAEFANKYEKDSDKVKEWYQSWKEAFDDEFKPFAEVMHSTFEDLPQYSAEKGESSDQKQSEQSENLEQVIEDELGEFNSDFEELAATLEDTVEKAYKAKDTEEFKALEKSQKEMEKYLKYVNRLFEVIIDFAEKKERVDVKENTQENVKVLLAWVDQRGKQQEDILKQVIDADPDFDTNPSQKSMKAIAKFFNGFTEDIKKIAAAIKKNPLKKMNKDNIMESVRKERKALLLEKALRKKIRKELLRR